MENTPSGIFYQLDHCKFDRFDILYKEYANRMLDIYEHPQIICSLSTQDVTFALARTGEELVCGYIPYNTKVCSNTAGTL